MENANDFFASSFSFFIGGECNSAEDEGIERDSGDAEETSSVHCIPMTSLNQVLDVSGHFFFFMPCCILLRIECHDLLKVSFSLFFSCIYTAKKVVL